jgi:hypothetical protein
MQRAEGLSLPARRIGAARLLERVVGIQEGPGLHLAIHLADAAEAGGGDLLARDPAFAERGREGANGKGVTRQRRSSP